MNELLDKMHKLDAEILDKITCVKDPTKSKQLQELRLKFADVMNQMALICS